MATGDPPSREAAGGNAAVLLELRQAGFPIPDFEVAPTDLAAAVARLGMPLAVRSSATVEDGRDASFAGQFLTFLNLATPAAVAEAVRRCRASASDARVLAYCRAHGVDPARLRVEVILQRMVQPELAGVAFTVNPMTGAEEVVIEAVPGLADSLLAGRASPLPESDPRLARHAPRIASLARRVQRHFGAPQDVEFAVEGDRVTVLQARPITRIAFSADIGEWTNADFRDGGVSSAVCTPLMWSLYSLVWEHTLKGFLDEVGLLEGDFQAGRPFFGRPYWNLGAVKRCLARLPGYREREFDADLNIEAVREGDGLATPVTLRGLLRTLPTLVAIRRFFANQEAFDRALLGGAFARLVSRYESGRADAETRFRELVERDYFLVEQNYFRTVFAASLAKLVFTASFPDLDHRSLVTALPPLRHFAPVHALRELAARGDSDVTPLLRRFRHHSRRGLDLRAPRWDEDRGLVEELLRTLPARNGDDPGVAYARARRSAAARMRWPQRRRFERQLDRLRAWIWLREEMRDLSSQMYYLIRRDVLEIARRRGLGDDLFFMTYQELAADDRSNVERNRERHESYRNFKAPNEIGSRYPFIRHTPDGSLRGIGASPGRARGLARVCQSVEEAARAERGAILVCPFTDPGWTPVLDRFAGVVTETGGLLSHAAVICREFGIPAVLGVAAATDRIPGGRMISLDGATGQIELEP